MNAEQQSPWNWSVPAWHADFGDPNVELDLLRAFCLALLSVQPDAKVELETPEPGLMYVRIELPDGTVAEVYPVAFVGNPAKRRLAIFLSPGSAEEEEVYAETIPSALTFFGRRLKGFSE